MTEPRHELAVGVALVGALVVLMLGLLWLQEFSLRGENVEVQVRFATVGGLGTGDPVHVRGIPMGKVDRVDLDTEGVLVDLMISRDANLTDEAEFQIGSLGFVGERFVSVEPGQGQPLNDTSGLVFEGKYEIAIPEMISQAQDLTAKLTMVLERADRLLAQVEEGGGLGETVVQTTRAAKLAADALESNAESFRKASTSMASVAERMDQFLAEHGESLGEGVEGLVALNTQVDSLVTRLIAVSDGTQGVLDALANQQGAAGKLIYDEKMGEDVQKSIETMRFLLEDLLRNPQRYLTVKIF
jgi:phospholipid/cholesterol/gamma-HCH transport system substrate-binding protein